MSVIPQLLPIEINQDKRRAEVLVNIVKMLTNRKLLNKENLESNIKKILSITSDDMIYSIKLDNPEIYYSKDEASKTFYIKFYNQKISGITKTSPVGEFLVSKKDNPKIVVVNSITAKVYDTIRNEYKYSEVFLEKDLMIDLVNHISVPKHELLSKEDSKALLDSYNVKKREMPKMYISDPVSRYYNAQVGQIFTITRPSEVSCLAPYHRLVIKGSIAK